MKKRILEDTQNISSVIDKAEKIQKKAASVGFDWQSGEQIIKKIEEELNEAREAIICGNVQDDLFSEIGDLIFCCINLARHYQVNPELALQGTNNKFIKRFNFIEDSLKRGGVSIFDASVEDMEKLWNKAKTETI